MTVTAVLGKWEADVVNPASTMFVAVDEQIVVGFVQVRADGAQGEVMALYVDPTRWSHSVGSALLNSGEEWLRASGADAATLWTAKQSERSRGFYENRGWVATGDEQTQYLGPSAVELHEVEYRKRFA